jgi:translocation protein SEC63
LKIAKAYAALTDEEARKNWETYGNPDGPGAMSFGIALPSWIVEKENSFLVLGLYALVFMIALPVAVGIWWYRSVKYGGDQVLLDTTQLYYYFIHKTPHMPLKRVLMVLASSLEFERNHNSEVIERPSDNEEVPHLMKLLPNLGEKNKERPLCFTYSIKARALLHAHLSRMQLPPHSLDIDKLYVVGKCPYLLQEFVQCVSQLTMLALAGRIARTPNLDTLEHTMKLSALVVQALWDSKNSLLQLPHVSEDMLRHFTTRKRNVRNIRQLASMRSDERRSMLRNLSDEQYENVMNVISKMPLLEIDVRSEVLDDEDAGIITAGAIVTVTVSLCRQNMSVLFDKEFIEEKSCIDNEEETEDKENLAIGEAGDKMQINETALKKPKVWEKQTKGKKKGSKSAKTKKTPKTAAIKKMAQNQSQQPKETTEANNQVIAVKKSKTKESDGESNDGSERGSDDESDVENSERTVSKATEEVSEHEEEEDNWDDFQKSVTKKKEPLEGKSKMSHSVHCPYFPDDKQEYWWIYLSDKKRHALISAPYLMTNLVDKEEVELKFTAPQKPGQYTYSVIVRSDSYVDFDISKTIKVCIDLCGVVVLFHLLSY